MKKQNKKKQFKESVHYSVKNRKAYKRQLWLIFLGLVAILCVCAVMFTFANFTWDPDTGFEPTVNPDKWWQILLVVCASLISVGSLVGFFFICYYSFRGFYNTQAAYWKSSEFKKTKAKALDVELYKLKKKDLKWYKKMGYLNADQIKQATEQRKNWIRSCKKNKQKVNYVKSKA